MNADAAAKIAMLRGSVRCFVLGLVGLLPFIGLPFAILALGIGAGPDAGKTVLERSQAAPDVGCDMCGRWDRYMGSGCGTDYLQRRDGVLGQRLV